MSGRRRMTLSWELRDSHQGEWKECNRASGEVPCGVCGKLLREHPQPLELSCPTMIEDCRGQWWKL